jgi:MtN3 and saliva related transmembrane protein
MRTNETFVLSLGFVAAAVTTSAWVPQAWKTVRSRSAKDFSWPSLTLLAVGIGLWLGYGLLRGDGAIVGANLLTLLLVLTIAAVKSRHG